MIMVSQRLNILSEIARANAIDQGATLQLGISFKLQINFHDVFQMV